MPAPPGRAYPFPPASWGPPPRSPYRVGRGGRRARGDRFLTRQQAAAALLYAPIAVIGAFPELAEPLGLQPIRA